jgi:putative transposase
MPRPEQIQILKHIAQEELQKRIKTLETNTKILQRLYFIKHRRIPNNATTLSFGYAF